MAYTASKPAGTDLIKDSDDIIKDNFTHIVAAINQEHVWDGTTATNCIHDASLFKFKVGTITRALNAVGAAVDTTGIGFVPQIVLFHTIAAISPLNFSSTGGSDGTNHSCVYHSSTSTPIQIAYNSDSYCIYLTEGNPVTAYQRATCAFATDKFTLTWTTSGMSSSNTAKIFYLCLRFSA